MRLASMTASVSGPKWLLVPDLCTFVWEHVRRRPKWFRSDSSVKRCFLRLFANLAFKNESPCWWRLVRQRYVFIVPAKIGSATRNPYPPKIGCQEFTTIGSQTGNSSRHKLVPKPGILATTDWFPDRELSSTTFARKLEPTTNRFPTVPSPRGDLVGLAPPNKAPSPPKLKREAL